MADKSYKFKKNILGRFYVDDQCIACDACLIEAPNFFTMDVDESSAFVYKQPKNSTDVAQCTEAMILCPVNAIGDDGD